jgi:hypothetical protein
LTVRNQGCILGIKNNVETVYIFTGFA